MKKTAAPSHRILVEIYGEHALAERTCQKWFARFQSGDFGLDFSIVVVCGVSHYT